MLPSRLHARIVLLTLAAFLAALSAGRAAPPTLIHYTVYNVASGLPPGSGLWDSITATGLNAQGTVVGGISLNGQWLPYASNSSIELLGASPGLDYEATGINDTGLIVGNEDNEHAVQWLPGNYGAPQHHFLGPPGWLGSSAAAVNNLGLSAGDLTESGTLNVYPAWWKYQPALANWLSAFGGGYVGDEASFAAISDSGAANGNTTWTAGTRNTAAGLCAFRTYYSLPGSPVPFSELLTSPGTVVTPSSLETEGYGVNDAGLVVGVKHLTSGEVRAVRWETDLSPTDLPPLAGDTDCRAFDINNQNRAVGASVDSAGNSRAVVWYGTQAVDLNTKIPANSGWVLLSATAINGAGQICGVGVLKHVVSAFRLDPHETPLGPVDVRWELLKHPSGPAVKLSFDDPSEGEDGFVLHGSKQVPGQPAEPFDQTFEPHPGTGPAELTFRIEPGTIYRVTLSAFNMAGTSEPGETLDFGVLPPVAPANLQVARGEPPQSSLAVSWDGSDQASYYRVRWRTLPSGQFIADSQAPRPTDRQYRVTGLADDTRYEIEVVAYSVFDRKGNLLAAGDPEAVLEASSAPATLKAATLMAAPARPRDVSAKAETTGIRVRWAAVPRAESYTVLREGARFPVGSSVGTTFVDRSVKPAVTYTYRVRAGNAGGESPASLPARIQSDPAPPRLSVKKKKGSFSLELSDTNGEERGYEWSLLVSPAYAVPTGTRLQGKLDGVGGTGATLPVLPNTAVRVACRVTFQARAYIRRGGSSVYSEDASIQESISR